MILIKLTFILMLLHDQLFQNSLSRKINLHNHPIHSKQLLLKTTSNSRLTKRLVNTLYFDSDLFQKQVISWWDKKSLTWALINHPHSLTWNETFNAFEKAFMQWSNVSQLEFKSVCSDFNCDKKNLITDITIQFTTAEQHDLLCKYKFSVSTLAHGFYPEVGISHFNIEKNWTINDLDNWKKSDVRIIDKKIFQYNLVAVATHEIGHLLGFGHSNNKESIMYPDYRSNGNIFHKNDIELVQALYGKPLSKKRSLGLKARTIIF